MWPDYIGLDPEPARTLARTTTGWSGSVDATLRHIQVAETLTGEPVGVQLALDDIGQSGRVMGTAITRAVDTVESYVVPDLGSALRHDLSIGSIDQAFRRAQVPLDDDWAPAMDGMVPIAQPDARWQAAAQDAMVPGGPGPRAELPVLDMSEATTAIAQLAAEVERLNGSFEAGVATDRRGQAFAELTAIGRTVTIDEATGFGLDAGTWVARDVAAIAIEWDVPYDEATLLHRRREILVQEPTATGHVELQAIATALTALHRDQEGEAPDRLSPGVFDGFVADRPESLGDPATLSDESLVRAIENWDVVLPDANGLLAALIDERNERAARGVLIANDFQREILTSEFNRRALGQLPQIADEEIDAHLVVEMLVERGFSRHNAISLAALGHEQFSGERVAAHRGIRAALINGDELLQRDLGQLPTTAEFAALASELGSIELQKLQLAYIKSVADAFDTYVEIAGEEPTPHVLLALTDYAISNGVTVAGVIRGYFELRPSNPPFGRTAAELTEPEVIELHMIREQEKAELEAMTSHGAVAELTDDAAWLFAYERPERNAAADAYSAATSGGLDELFQEQASIEAFIAEAIGPVPLPEQVQAQIDLIQWLDELQYGVSLAGADHFDVLDADQVAVLQSLQHHWDELLALRTPSPLPFDGTGYWGAPVLSANGLRDGEPFRPHDTIWQAPIPVDEISQLLADNAAAPKPFLSPGLHTTLAAMIGDPQLLEVVAPRSADLHAPPRDVGMIDFDRVHRAASEQLLAAITSPWADDIDAFKPGREVDGNRVRTDWQQWISDAETDPAIPAMVVDAAREVVASGLHDGSPLDAAHVVLAVVAASRAPVLSQVAAVVDAGLYFLLDKDATLGVLALAGAALSGAGRVASADELGQLLASLDRTDNVAAVVRSTAVPLDVSATALGAVGVATTLDSVSPTATDEFNWAAYENAFEPQTGAES